jgi:RNA recognition motif-containing protein
MNIFVGNLSFDAVEEDVKKLFEGFGAVINVVIVKEKNGKKSRGFGFVEMADDSRAQAAIAALNLKEFMGRPLNVSPEKPKSDLEGLPEKKKKLPEKIKPVSEEYHGQKDFGKDKWFSPVFRSAEGDRKRRSRGSSNRFDQGTPQERGKSWRKPEGEKTSWRKPEGEKTPWRKPEAGARPWRKNAEESKPAKRYGQHPKPWRKTEGEARPRRSPEAEFKPWGKPGKYSSPAGKTNDQSRPRPAMGKARIKPWKKTTGFHR